MSHRAAGNWTLDAGSDPLRLHLNLEAEKTYVVSVVSFSDYYDVRWISQSTQRIFTWKTAEGYR